MRILFKLLYWCLSSIVLIIIGVVTAHAEQIKKPMPAISPVSTGSLLQIFLVLVAIVACILLIAFMGRRYSYGQYAKDNPIQAHATLPLSPKERIVLVSCGGTQLLVGIGPNSMQTLHVLDKPIRLDEQRSSNFMEYLKTAVNKGAK